MMTTEQHAHHELGVARLAASAGISTTLVFILCWLGTFVPFSSPTHAFIGLFTPAEVRSVAALAEGSLWSLLFGMLSGALFAVIYNQFAMLDRR
jgi:hypothetical protein